MLERVRKRALIGCVVVGCATAGEAGSASYEERYRGDADVLAVRVTEADAAGGALPLTPSPALIDSLLTGLISVARMEHPARDSVVADFAIHAVGFPHEVTIAVEQGAAWLDAWFSHRALTGDAAIDSVVRALDLVVVRAERFLGSSYVTLRSPRPMSMRALRARLASVPYIRDVGEAYAPVGRATTDVVADRVGSGWRFDYRFRWGDCPAGCIHHHSWSFVVDGAGRARYVGSIGDPIHQGAIRR